MVVLLILVVVLGAGGGDRGVMAPVTSWKNIALTEIDLIVTYIPVGIVSNVIKPLLHLTVHTGHVKLKC